MSHSRRTLRPMQPPNAVSSIYNEVTIARFAAVLLQLCCILLDAIDSFTVGLVQFYRRFLCHLTLKRVPLSVICRQTLSHYKSNRLFFQCRYLLTNVF